MDIETLSQAIERHPLLALLDASTRAALSPACTLIPYGAQRTVWREGEASDHVRFLISGAVRLFHHRHGHEVVIALLGAPATFGDTEALANMPFQGRANTLVRSQVLQIPTVVFRRLLDRCPALAVAVARELSQRLCRAAVHASALLFDSVDARLCALLVDYATLFGDSDPDGGVKIAVALSQKSLARDLGASCRAVFEAMDNLKKSGLVRKVDGRYALLDVPAMRALAVSA